MNEISLPGCTPEPLMSYLKALGVFRLVAEQADPTVTMEWRGGACRLNSVLGRDGLTAFFLNDYRPTPIIGPWGARSGFYPGSPESSAREALNAIVSAAESQDRFRPFRDAIVAVRDILKTAGFAEKVRDDDKLALMRMCRNELPEAVVPWLDAVFVLTDDSRKFPPLLGTGGNEGSGSYVSVFAQLVVSLLIRRESDDGLASALYGDFSPTHRGVSVGHFHPGAIGGPNSSQGVDGGGGANPWDYLLAIEGTLMLAGAAARRMGTDSSGRAAYPFCVEPIAVGYASESDKEAANATRAELWLPLWWKRPVTYGELRQLFSEGRAQFGRRQAKNSVEFALATNLLGISRGVDAFVRYGFVMRNGLSYFAAPLGRVPVVPRPSARLLNDPGLARWIDRLRLACRDTEKTPIRYRTILRQIDREFYEFAARGNSGSESGRAAFISVLRALGRAEKILSSGLRFCEDHRLRPLQGLSCEWLDQTDDGSPEFRLAASLAGMRRQASVGPLRTYLEPVEARGGTFFWAQEGSVTAVWSNGSLASNLAAVFRRRLVDAFRDPELAGVPLASYQFARLDDVIAFLHEGVDDDKLADLVWGLSALDWSTGWDRISPSGDVEVPFEFGVPRLLVQPLTITARWPSDSIAPPGDGQFPARSQAERAKRGQWQCQPSRGEATNAIPDPEVFHSLASGQRHAIGTGVDRAARRLKSGGYLVIGYRNRLSAGRALGVVSRITAERLLASMLFPLSPRDLEAIANSVLYPPEMEG